MIWSRKEKARVRAREWYGKNKTRAKTNIRAWAERNPEKIKAYRIKRRKKAAAWKRKWYLNRRQKEIIKATKWAKNNPDRRREIAAQSSRRRKYGLTSWAFEVLLKQQGGEVLYL